MNPLIELRQVNLSLQGRHIIQDVSFQLEEEQITTLIGPNGSGKTTLTRMVLGLLRPDNGDIIRRHDLRIGYMPQKLQLESTMPLTVARFMQLPRKHNRQILISALEEVGVEHLIDSPIQKLSGGETQRVMLARAMLREPQLLVLDEPAQGVDITGQIELYKLITDIKQRHGCTVLMVSHDLHLVMASTDQVICLNHHVCCSGHPELVSADPAFIALFGQQGADTLALYNHQHNHQHDAHGEVIQDHPCQHEHPHHHHG